MNGAIITNVFLTIHIQGIFGIYLLDLLLSYMINTNVE
jgi:hypothetical protein